MAYYIEGGFIFLSGAVDFASLTAKGYELGPSEPAFGTLGERLHFEGHPVFRSRILRAPALRDVGGRAAPVAPSSSSPTLDDGVRAVFDRHLGPRVLPATGDRIPAPDAPTALQLLDLELERRGDAIAGLRQERDEALSARHEASGALERAIWERDRAQQDLAALRAETATPTAEDESAS